MGAVQSDVKMVITAQNAASTAIDAVSAAVQRLVGVQKEAGVGSSQTASALDGLRTVVEKVTGVFSTLNQSADASIARFQSQTAALEETKSQLLSVTQQLENAGNVISKLEAGMAAVGAPTQRFVQELTAAREGYAALSKQSDSLTASILKQETALGTNINRVQGVASAANAMDASLKDANATIAQTVREQEQLGQAAREAVSQAQRLVPVALRPIAPAATEAQSAINGMWTSLRSFVGTLLTVPSAEQRAATGLVGFGNSGRNALSVAQRLRAEVMSLASAYIGFYGAIGAFGKVLDANNAIQAAQQKLGVVFSQNTQQVGAEIDFLREQAVRLGLNFQTLVDQYSMLSVAAQSAGLSLDQNRKLFLSISEAARVLHLNQETTNRVFLAFTEMLSRGTIQSQQLQRMLGTSLPGATRIFADALGVSEQKLVAMMHAGQVFADSDTMGKVADTLSAKYGAQLPEALKTTQAELGRLQSVLQQNALGFGGGGFIDAFTDGIRKLNNYLQTQNAQQFFASLGRVAGNLIGILPTLANNIGLVVDAFKAWLAVKVDLWLLGAWDALKTFAGGLTASRATIASWNLGLELMAATASGPARIALVGLSEALFAFETILVRATTLVRGLWAAIGGWPGLIFTAATFILQSFLGKWLAGVGDANTALEEHKRIIDDIRQAYIDAAAKVDGWADKLKNLTQAEIRQNSAQLQQSVASSTAALTSHIAYSPGQPNGSPFAAADDPKEVQLYNMIAAFKSGKTAAADFLKQLDAFQQVNPAFTDIVVGIQKSTKAIEDSKNGIEQNNAAIAQLNGTATQAQKVLLGIVPKTNGWPDATRNVEAFNDALNNLKKLSPSLKEQIALSTDLTSAKQAYDSAISKAGKDPALLTQAKQAYDQVVAYLRAKATADAASYFPKDNSAIIERIIYVESKGISTAQNPNSSAAGVGQITADTWRSLVDMLKPEYASQSDAFKDALRDDQAFYKQALELLTKMNQQQLAKAGIPVDAANTYLAHFLGAGTAIKMILANPDELASKIAGAAATRANPKVLGNGATAGGVTNWASAQMGGGSPIISSTGQTEQEKLNAAIAETIQGYQDETKAIQDQQTQSARALFIAQQIEDAKKKAGQTAVVTPEEIAQITKWAGALYDAKNAAEQAKKAVQDAVSVNEQRTTAIQDLQNAFKDGSSGDEVDALKTKVAALTTQLLNTYAAARLAMGSLHGEDADRAQAELDKINQSIATLKTGLTDAKQINGLLADDFVQSWDDFLSTLNQTGSVLSKIRNLMLSYISDFLKNIDEMILKQTILNALSQTSIGKWISGAVNDVTGTGSDAAGSAALSAAGTTLNTAGAALNESAVALNSAAAALSSSGGLGGLGGLGGAAGSSGGLSDFFDSISAWFASLHSGGIAGQSGGMKRAVNPLLFAGAQRFHMGGLPGLRSNEIPTILERGEEVLRRNDPRHAFNGGGRNGVSPNVNVPVKIVNLLDAADLISHGLSSSAGEKALLNVIRSNAGAVRVALGS